MQWPKLCLPVRAFSGTDIVADTKESIQEIHITKNIKSCDPWSYSFALGFLHGRFSGIFLVYLK